MVLLFYRAEAQYLLITPSLYIKPRIGRIYALAYSTNIWTSSALLTLERNTTALPPWL